MVARRMYQLEERTYLNADKTKVVPEGDPEARWLLGVPGQLIAVEDADRYGLTGARETTPLHVEAEARFSQGASLSDETMRMLLGAEARYKNMASDELRAELERRQGAEASTAEGASDTSQDNPTDPHVTTEESSGEPKPESTGTKETKKSTVRDKAVKGPKE